MARQAPCVIAGMRVQISVPTDDSLVLTLTATVSRLKARSTADDTVVQAVLRDVPLGLPPLLSSVFNAPLESSPGLLPITDQSPTAGIPSRSPNGVAPLLALKRHLSGMTGFISRGVQMLRVVSRSTSDNLSGAKELSNTSSHALMPTAEGNRLYQFTSLDIPPLPPNSSAPPTIAGLLGISARNASASSQDAAMQTRLQSTEEDLQPVSPRLTIPPMPRGSSSLGSSAFDDALTFRPTVVLTALEYVPGARVARYLGRINIHLIKESPVVRESNGLASFSYPFMLQAHAIARAHVEALGGNALLSFRMIRRDSGGQKNQTYNILSLSGDAALVSFLPLRNHSSVNLAALAS